MKSADEKVSDQQKELCAVSVMRSMLEDYSALNHIDFEQALLMFGQSKTYQAIMTFQPACGVKARIIYAAGLRTSSHAPDELSLQP